MEEDNIKISFVEVVFTTECAFCPVPITQEKDDWLVNVMLPGKQSLNSHPVCFELVTWYMTNFVFDNRGVMEPTPVLN